MGKEAKTNAMRILEREKVPYTAHEYAHEEGVAVAGVDVADKVHLQLLSTDESKPREARVARQTTKNGLYNALDIGSIWLQKANENG